MKIRSVFLLLIVRFGYILSWVCYPVVRVQVLNNLMCVGKLLKNDTINVSSIMTDERIAYYR